MISNKKIQMTPPRHIWLRLVLWFGEGFFIVMLVVLAAALTAKFWLVPEIATKKINSRLADFWDGSAKVGKIEFNYFAPTILKNITFRDKSQRDWLRVDALKVTIEDLFHFSPKLKKLEVGRLEINLYLAQGHLIIPVKPSPNKSNGSLGGYLDLDEIVINDGSISVEDQLSTRIICDNLRFSALRNQQNYEISLVQQSPQFPGKLSVTGIVAPDFQTNLLFQIDRIFEKSEVDPIFTLFDIPQNYQARGRLTADMTISGSLKDPYGLKPNGRVSLDRWAVFMEQRLLADRLNMRIKVDDRSFIIESLEAAVCNGQISGSFYADNKRLKPAEFGGRISAEKINLPQLAQTLDYGKKTAKGIGTLRYEFTAREKDLQSMQGQGLILLNDISITALPVTSKIFQFIGLQAADPFQTSDAAAVFKVSGNTAIIEKAQIAGAFGAIYAEPGGTVNLKTGQLDLYVFAVHFKQIDEFFGSLPLINILFRLKNRLSRLRVKGHWSEPTNKLITKEPLGDIKEGTLGFFRDVVDTKGQFTDTVFKGFGELFKGGK